MTGSSYSQEPVRATVTAVCGSSSTRYAVTKRDDTGQTVTFALLNSIWNQPTDPIVGEVVELSSVYRTKRGFRANVARRITA